MKRLFTLVVTLLLGASLSFAVPQTGGSTDQGATKSETGKKGKKTSKAHKGGKKSKKGKGGDTTPPPK